MGNERDYESEYEKKKNNQLDFQFTGGSEGLIENPPPGARRNRGTIPVDQRYYKPGTATRNAEILAQRYSNLNQSNQQTQAKNLEEEQKQLAAKPQEDKPGFLEWLLGALAGEFNSDPSVSQIGADLGVSLIPILDQVSDVRDILAHAYWMLFRGEYKSPARWVALAFTLIGIVPEIGSVIKSISKYAIKGTEEAAKHIDEILGAIAPILPDGGIAGVQKALASNWGNWVSSGKQLWVNSIQRLRGIINAIPGIPGIAAQKQAALAQLDELLATTDELLDGAFAEARRRLDEILEQLGIRRQQLAMSTEGGGRTNPGRVENQPRNEPLQMSGTPSGGGSVSYGANASDKLRSIAQRIRTLARRQGIDIPKGAGKPDTQQAMRDYIDFIVDNGETVAGAYKPTGGGDLNALWTRYGDTILIRRSNGEFLTILDATAGGQALNSPF